MIEFNPENPNKITKKPENITAKPHENHTKDSATEINKKIQEAINSMENFELTPEQKANILEKLKEFKENNNSGEILNKEEIQKILEKIKQKNLDNIAKREKPPIGLPEDPIKITPSPKVPKDPIGKDPVKPVPLPMPGDPKDPIGKDPVKPVPLPMPGDPKDPIDIDPGFFQKLPDDPTEIDPGFYRKLKE